ncbi:hypothetical protein JKY79_02340 [Candidatus Babeliales bacterium]|nr:hypothetical protein [Candidatus Babeliales bacterium]
MIKKKILYVVLFGLLSINTVSTLSAAEVEAAVQEETDQELEEGFSSLKKEFYDRVLSNKVIGGDISDVITFFEAMVNKETQLQLRNEMYFCAEDNKDKYLLSCIAHLSDLSNGDLPIFKYLIDQDFSIDDDLLHTLVEQKSDVSDLIGYLCKVEIEENIVNRTISIENRKINETPLHRALSMHNKNLYNIKKLIDHGADVSPDDLDYIKSLPNEKGEWKEVISLIEKKRLGYTQVGEEEDRDDEEEDSVFNQGEEFPECLSEYDAIIQDYGSLEEAFRNGIVCSDPKLVKLLFEENKNNEEIKQSLLNMKFFAGQEELPLIFYVAFQLRSDEEDTQNNHIQNREIFTYLVSQGVDLTEKCKGGTILHWIAGSKEDFSSCINSVVLKDPDLKNILGEKKGETALSACFIQQPVIASPWNLYALIKAGTQVTEHDYRSICNFAREIDIENAENRFLQNDFKTIIKYIHENQLKDEEGSPHEKLVKSEDFEDGDWSIDGFLRGDFDIKAGSDSGEVEIEDPCNLKEDSDQALKNEFVDAVESKNLERMQSISDLATKDEKGALKEMKKVGKGLYSNEERFLLSFLVFDDVLLNEDIEIFKYLIDNGFSVEKEGSDQGLLYYVMQRNDDVFQLITWFCEQRIDLVGTKIGDEPLLSFLLAIFPHILHPANIQAFRDKGAPVSEGDKGKVADIINQHQSQNNDNEFIQKSPGNKQVSSKAISLGLSSITALYFGWKVSKFSKKEQKDFEKEQDENKDIKKKDKKEPKKNLFIRYYKSVTADPKKHADDIAALCCSLAGLVYGFKN